MVFHGQKTKFYEKIKRMWRKQIRKSRVKIRPRRWDFFGRVRSLYVKQFRSNIWANARFKKNYAKKLSVYFDFEKDLERGFSRGHRPTYLFDVGGRNALSSAVLLYLRRKHKRFRKFQFPIDVTANKKFYKKFFKKSLFRHNRHLQLHRIKSFLGNPKIHYLRKIWRTGTIKGNVFSANLFTYRFLSRLPHLLYFTGFTVSLEFATHLVSWGFVLVNDIVITNKEFLVPVMARVQLELPLFYKQICIFMLFPYHRIYVSPFLEINWKLFSVRFLRIPTFREVVLPSGTFDHMFLYEQLAQVVK